MISIPTTLLWAGYTVLNFTGYSESRHNTREICFRSSVQRLVSYAAPLVAAPGGLTSYRCIANTTITALHTSLPVARNVVECLAKSCTCSTVLRSHMEATRLMRQVSPTLFRNRNGETRRNIINTRQEMLFTRVRCHGEDAEFPHCSCQLPYPHTSLVCTISS